MNRNLQTTLVGAVGGFAGFLLSEFLSSGSVTGTFWQLVFETMVWTALYVLP